jgi:Protein of unknown function (DUF2840)
MMQHGLSGTATLGPSGTGSSDYREPKRLPKPRKTSAIFALNDPNKESFGFLLTTAHLWTKSSAATERPADINTGDDLPLTHVTLVWREGQHEDWIKFGRPVAERILSRSERIESYMAGEVFALVRWASNDYGTVRSTLDIVQAVSLGEHCATVPQVEPGGELLLSVHGWPKVAQVFRLIDAIEASGIDPCDVAPDHWRHIHNRLKGRLAPREYTPARHQAWLQRKALLP